jgi:hypothetical protein
MITQATSDENKTKNNIYVFNVYFSKQLLPTFETSNITDLSSTLHIEVIKPYRLSSTSNTCEHIHPRQDVKDSAHMKPTTSQLL